MRPRKSCRNLTVMFLLGSSLIITMPTHAQSASDCSAQAERAARGSTTVMGGAARGAVGGAAVGAIVGNRKSARRGAAIGAVAGGATQAARKNSRYKQVYDDCMRGYQSHY
jgi:uncharacterized protein YcfJ